MAEIIVTTLDGEAHNIQADSGLSIMEIIRNADIDELAALCGGSCSCATCHVYIATEDQASMPIVSDAEDDLLDGSEFRTSTSRLSCQLVFDESMAGLQVKIAPEG